MDLSAAPLAGLGMSEEIIKNADALVFTAIESIIHFLIAWVAKVKQQTPESESRLLVLHIGSPWDSRLKALRVNLTSFQAPVREKIYFLSNTRPHSHCGAIIDPKAPI